MTDTACEFNALPEHHPDECPRCNPSGWMAAPTTDQKD